MRRWAATVALVAVAAATVFSPPPQVAARANLSEISAPAGGALAQASRIRWSWTLCVDFEPRTVAIPPLGTKSSVPGYRPSASDKTAIMSRVTEVFGSYYVNVKEGVCEGERTATIHVMDWPTPEISKLTIGFQFLTGGVAYVGFWGVPVLNTGFVFAGPLGFDRWIVAGTIIHEAGHIAGLNHPVAPDQYVMTSGSSPYGFSPGDDKLLRQFFSRSRP